MRFKMTIADMLVLCAVVLIPFAIVMFAMNASWGLFMAFWILGFLAIANYLVNRKLDLDPSQTYRQEEIGREDDEISADEEGDVNDNSFLTRL